MTITMEQTIGIIIQGGAVGIALVALYVIYKMQNGQSRRSLEALERNTDAWVKNAEALGMLTAHLDSIKPIKKQK